MPDGRKLFAVTQWVLRAGIIVTMVLIGMYVLGVAAMIFALITSRVPLDRIAHWTGVTMTADEIGRMALAAFAGAIAALTLIQLILRALRRVVASASVGDPFIEANAVDFVRVTWPLAHRTCRQTAIRRAGGAAAEGRFRHYGNSLGTHSDPRAYTGTVFA